LDNNQWLIQLGSIDPFATFSTDKLTERFFIDLALDEAY